MYLIILAPENQWIECHIKIENNLVERKILESAAIRFCQNINLLPRIFQISRFLKEIILFEGNRHDYENAKKFKESD